MLSSLAIDIFHQTYEENENLLVQFSKSLAKIHEWAGITIWEKTDDIIRPFFCIGYEHSTAGDPAPCPSNGAKDRMCEKCNQSPLGTDIALIETSGIHKITLNGDRRYYQLIDLHQVLSRKHIPEITTKDLNLYRHFKIACLFPTHTFFPDVKDDLATHYLRKQIEALRLIILHRKIKSASIQSAISSFMLRNHSHHIGSHVTPRTSCLRVKERIRELCSDVKDDQLFGHIANLKDRLDEYIQKKADFIAEVVTSPITTTVSKPLFSVVLSNFISNSLLMDNLGANEGIRYINNYENMLRFNLRYHVEGASGIEATGNATYLASEEDSVTFSGNTDISIAWPGPLGEFALYAFLENYIRNAVKHNSEKIVNSLDINLDVTSVDQDFYSVKIYDNVTDPALPIGDSTLLEYMESLVSRDVIDSDGKLRKGAWGVAEMKIMATLLSGSDDFLAMKDNLIVKEENGRLVYEFKLLKPRELVVISSRLEADIIPLMHAGIYLFPDIGKFKTWCNRSCSPATFPLAVLDDIAIDQLDQIAHLLPFRLMEYRSIDNIHQLLIENETEEIISICWQSWKEEFLSCTGNPADATAGVFFLQKRHDLPTKIWGDKAESLKETGGGLNVVHLHDAKTTKPKPMPFVPTRGIRHQIEAPSFIYDRHYGAHESFTSDSIKFHQILDKSSADFSPIYFADPSSKTIVKLIESGCLNILVLDERVAERAFDEIDKQVSGNPYPKEQRIRLEVAKRANVYIGTHLSITGSLSTPIHKSIENKYPQVHLHLLWSGEKFEIEVHWYQSPEHEKQLLKPYCLILHLSFAETKFKKFISQAGCKTLNENLMKFISDIRKDIPYCLVDSGSGVPSNLPAHVKYIPFSLLSSFLMQNRIAKFSLTDIIMSLTRRS